MEHPETRDQFSRCLNSIGDLFNFDASGATSVRFYGDRNEDDLISQVTIGRDKNKLCVLSHFTVREGGRLRRKSVHTHWVSSSDGPRGPWYVEWATIQPRRQAESIDGSNRGTTCRGWLDVGVCLDPSLIAPDGHHQMAGPSAPPRES